MLFHCLYLTFSYESSDLTLISFSLYPLRSLISFLVLSSPSPFHLGNLSLWHAMGLSSEAIIAIVGVLCTVPSCIAIYWHCYRRRTSGLYPSPSVPSATSSLRLLHANTCTSSPNRRRGLLALAWPSDSVGTPPQSAASHLVIGQYVLVPLLPGSVSDERPHPAT